MSVSVFVASLFLSSTVLATDLTVTCDESSCTSSPSSGPVFNESNMLPLDTITRTVKVENTSGNSLNFATEVVDAAFSDTTPPLSGILTVTITEQESVSVVYGPETIEQWKTDGFVILSSVPGGGERNYDFTITMANVGNDYQGKTLIFDLNLGFDAFPPSSSPTPTPILGGTVLGAVGASVCTATVPTSAPVLSAYASSVNTVVLTWTPVSPITHYTIHYGTSSGSYIYGAPDVGNITSFAVSALSGGTTYYFQIRGVNDCMPGPWSNEVNATSFGVVLPPGPAPGFTEGVLGIEKEEEAKGLKEEVLGEEVCADEYYVWWLPLVVQTILTLGYLCFIKKRKEETKRWWLVPILLATLSQVIHGILSCNCATGEWCPRYWLFNLAVLIISILICYFFLRGRKRG